ASCSALVIAVPIAPAPPVTTAIRLRVESCGLVIGLTPLEAVRLATVQPHPSGAAPRHRASRPRRPGSPAGERRSRFRGMAPRQGLAAAATGVRPALA